MKAEQKSIFTRMEEVGVESYGCGTLKLGRKKVARYEMIEGKKEGVKTLLNEYPGAFVFRTQKQYAPEIVNLNLCFKTKNFDLLNPEQKKFFEKETANFLNS